MMTSHATTLDPQEGAGTPILKNTALPFFG